MRGNFESVVALAQEVERIDNIKQDYLVPTKDMRMTEDGVAMSFKDDSYILTPYAHGQVSSKLNIPKKYYDYIQNIPGLRAQNINALLDNLPRNRYLLRTLDENIRAFLSDRFKPIDNSFIMRALLPVLKEFPDVKVRSSSLSDMRMYIQFSIPSIYIELKKGVRVEAGCTLTNSEVGAGALDILDWARDCSCDNGMIRESIMRKYHVGRRVGNEEGDYNIFGDDTMVAELRSYQLRIRDLLKHSLTQARFEASMQKTIEAAGMEIENPKLAIENVTKKFNFPDSYSNMVFKFFMERGDTTKFGLASSITRMAQEIESPEVQFGLEELGANIINLSPAQWKEITE